SHHVGMIFYPDAHNPAMIIAAIAVKSRISHVHEPVHKRQCTAFFLHIRSESWHRSVHIDRPVGRAMVTVQEKIKSFLGVPPIIASKKSDRETRSTTGVPVIPTGLIFPHGRPEVTGGPTLTCQTTVPVGALSA